MVNIEMCWIDLETTGLDARGDIPLEVGIKLTDRFGEVTAAEWKTLVWESSLDWSKVMGLGAAHSIVGPMHQKSGLWDDLLEQRGKTTRTRAETDEYLCDFLTGHEVRFGTLPMSGSSIGSLDRPFAQEHFPNFNAALSYRNIDISSIKELCKMHNPVLFENLQPIIGSKDDAAHRVLEDIDSSIIEYQAYLDNFLITED